MQQQQVDLFDAELGGALLEPVQGSVVAEVADPQLGLDEDLLAWHPGGADACADLTLVAVGGSGVDVPVAQAQGFGDCGGGLLGRSLEDAETDGRQRDVVVQGDGGG